LSPTGRSLSCILPGRACDCVYWPKIAVAWDALTVAAGRQGSEQQRGYRIYVEEKPVVRKRKRRRRCETGFKVLATGGLQDKKNRLFRFESLGAPAG